jgi:adhesin transport system outer membrane protein
MVRIRKKSLINYFLVASASLGVVQLQALTLKQSVSEVINTNPVVKERISNYRATQQDLKIAESEYLPSIDLRSGLGYKDAGNLNNEIRDVSYDYYENSLKLTQNLFNGFDTTYKVDYQEARILAAGYHYLEKANDIAFRMVESYLNVLKNYRLLQNAQDSVNFHQQMYEDIQNLYNAGLNTASSISKVKAGLALAKTNYIVQKNNVRDAEFNFARILGRKPNVLEMEFPSLDVQMPETIQRATMYAIKNNPSMLVSNYNIEGAKALYKKSKSGYYPKIDFEIEQLYHDYHTDSNGFDSPDDRFRVGLQLNWNLYKGGADEAAQQKAISKVHQELQIHQDLKRQVIEGLELSWSAYDNIQEQIAQLQEYSKFSESTLVSYKEEYSLGKRSLLDFIIAHNDVVNSRAQMIKAQHEQLFAQYRLLDAMGLLVTVVMGDQASYEKMVNINSDNVVYNLDTLPINLDVDGDKIVNHLDICDNSLSSDKDHIMPYGCKKSFFDPNKERTLKALKNNKIFEKGEK